MTSKSNESPASWIRSALIYGAIIGVVYLANVQVQTYFGKRALAATELVSEPFAGALARAGRENRQVLVELSAIWCPTCRQVDKRVLSVDAVKTAITSRYVFSRLEYESDEAEAFMTAYGVRGYPTFLVLSTDGELVRRLPLTFDPQRFIESL